MSITLCLLLTFLIPSAVRPTRYTPPSVWVASGAPCEHEPHAHADEDIRVRTAVRIKSTDPCGFVYETKHEISRLLYDDEVRIGLEDATLQLKLVGRENIHPGTVAMIFFCSYCNRVLAIKVHKDK